jgi:hypothetical protein
MKNKFVCIHIGRVKSLTLNKIYDGFTSPMGSTIKVVDDNGYTKSYKGERFMRLSEFRQNKLKELGI